MRPFFKSIGIAGLVLPFMFSCASCATAPASMPPHAPEFSNPFAPSTGFVARAVVAGLTAVDPLSYEGWSGACPGCDVDSEIFHAMCQERGAQAALFQNAAATRSNLAAAARAAWADMQPGDLFLFYVSGHGGQQADADGDEADGVDETICLWDGPLSDDVLRDLWDEVPAGVRVFVVTDTCHSGTNFRYKPRSLRASIPREFKGALIHYGGCADNAYSYGDASGGTFTTALVDAWDRSITYLSWFEAAAKTMPINHIPTYAEWGDVTDDVRNAPVFQ
jgi:hypothetical protein